MAIARVLNMINELATPGDDAPARNDDGLCGVATAEGIQLNLAVATIADLPPRGGE